jgi:hypothetical protein
MVFAKKMAETRLASLKEVEPKLQAFYDSLDAKQKTLAGASAAYSTGGARNNVRLGTGGEGYGELGRPAIEAEIVRTSRNVCF